MKNTLTLWISLIILSISNIAVAQTKWSVFLYGDILRNVTVHGSRIYAGTDGGGAIKIDTLTGITRFSNNANSGLPSNDVTCYTVDNFGNEWMGTHLGLVKFDGTNWTLYNSNNSALPNNDIFWIEVDKNGILWVSCQGAMVKYDYNTWTVYSGGTGSPFVTDGLGNKWGGSNLGLFKLNTTTGIWTVYNTSNSSIPNDLVESVAIDSSGNIWAGTFNGLAKFDGITWTVYSTFNSQLPGNRVRAAACDTAGVMWFGTGGGFTRFDGTNWSVFNNINSPVQGWVRSIAIDSLNRKWLAVSNNGLLKFDDNGAFSKYNTSNCGLPDNTIRAAYYDSRDSTVYFAHEYGVTLFDSVSSIVSHNLFNSTITGNQFRSVLKDSTGNLWVASASSGLNKFDGSTWTNYNTTNSPLPSIYISSITLDSTGVIWVATNSGITRYNGSSWNPWTTPSIPGGGADFIRFDTPGNIWVSNFSGLSKYDGNSWTNFNASNSGLPTNTIDHFIIDSSGTIWLASDSGVTKYDGTNWITYNTANSGLPINDVRCLMVDDHQNLWVGTIGGGLASFDGNNWKVYNMANSGLPIDYVFCLTHDHSGNIWIGTIEGVARLNEACPEISNINLFISGKVFHDVNSDGQQNFGEDLLANQQVLLLPDSMYTFTDPQGWFYFPCDTGAYTVAFAPDSLWVITTPGTFSTVVSNQPMGILPFGTLSSQGFYKLEAGIYGGFARCDELSGYSVHITNMGSLTASGKVKLSIDSLLTYISASPSPAFTYPDSLIWLYNNLQTYQSQAYDIILQAPSFISMGDSVLLDVVVTADTSSTIVASAADTIQRIVTCSYDPNMKEGKPAGNGQDGYTPMGEDLTYTVYFQNTGNDTAYNITIVDTLSPFLDHSTYQFITASHYVNVQMQPGGRVEYVFNHIMLPDSTTDELNSHGFFRYRISHIASLPDSTRVLNTAYIYFDNNPPVITNTTINTMVLPMVNNLMEEHFTTSNVFIHPNPVNNSPIIRFDNKYDKALLRVYDNIGRMVFEQPVENNRPFRVERLPAGLYNFTLLHNNIMIGKGRFVAH